MELDVILAAVLGVVFVVGIGMIVRNLWLAATDPKVAYVAGRKLRRTVEKGAHTAGQVSGTVESAAGVVTRSFRQGRNAAKGSDRDVEGGLTMRSSRSRFVTQSTWQVELAMCFAPLRVSA